MSDAKHGICLGTMFNTDGTMTVSVFGDLNALTEKEMGALCSWLHRFAHMNAPDGEPAGRIVVADTTGG